MDDLRFLSWKKITYMACALLAVILLASFCATKNALADDPSVTITVPGTFAESVMAVERDGVPVAKTATANPREYSILVNENTRFLTVFEYNGDVTNENSYPVHMYVWEINHITEPDHYEAVRLEGFDDILGYHGFAIRPANAQANVKSGFRCSLSITTDVKENGLVVGDEQRYTVEEYGHLHIFSRNWTDESYNHMTYGDLLVKNAPCFKRSTGTDIVLRVDGTRTVFANSVYNIVDYNAVKHFRGYIKLHKPSTDEYVYLYGPIVGRNPYYVAKNIHDDATKWAASSPAIKTYIETIIDAVDNPTVPPEPDPVEAIFIGDSIMMGMTLKDGVTDPDGPEDYVQVTYPPSRRIGALLAERLNTTVNCTLVANGGATYSEPGVNYQEGALANMPLLAARAVELVPALTANDYVFIMAGVNDWAYRDQGEEGFDGETALFGEHYGGEVKFKVGDHYVPYGPENQSYCIGIDRTIKTLLNTYPTATILVCSPLRALWDSGPGTEVVNASTNKTLSDYCYVQGAIPGWYRTHEGKKIYSLNLYDRIVGDPDAEYKYMNIIAVVPEYHPNFRNYFPDGYHPNQAGYDIMCRAVIDEMTDQNLLPAPAAP
ncbi:MAG: SGNH/GDSL hydrolase family protein [Lachnospiraceae bacterium]|nr:SGNH/GDSL hydrolase family protein [Lachnospiraceae bacterium]